ncbi:hypothetical protein B0H10DRAFT_1795962 [Mycena sp. CBHHK59/15]|nr:hypothetical protein B0H10DRAFT_1795962 [Mycena sp. CBHHK59/15]
MSDSQVIDLSDRDTQFSSHESDAEHLYDAVEIVAEKRGLYLVKWDGVDPTTGKPWPNSWTHKRDCTDDLVQAWKLKQSRKRREAQQRKGMHTCSAWRFPFD